MSPRPPAAPRPSAARRPPRPPEPDPASSAPRPARPARRPAAGATRAPREPGRVSLTSAQRFARKVMLRRRKRILGAVAVVAVLAGLTWLVLGSAWLRVQTVAVSGTVRLDPDLVRRAALPSVGRPMVLADVATLRSVVGKQDVVKDVRVERGWPSTLRVVVVERTPVAAVPAGGDMALVDEDGVVVERVAKAPAGLPVIEIDLVDERAAPSLRAGLAVLAALPETLRGQVRTIGADTPDAVWFVLKDKSRVVWGSDDQSDLKADVLVALLPQKAKLYDVSAPTVPAVRD